MKKKIKKKIILCKFLYEKDFFYKLAVNAL